MAVEVRDGLRLFMQSAGMAMAIRQMDVRDFMVVG